MLYHLFVNTNNKIFQVKPKNEPIGSFQGYCVYGVDLSDRELKYLTSNLNNFEFDFGKNWPRHKPTGKLLSRNLCTPLRNEFQHLTDKRVIELLYHCNVTNSCEFLTKELLDGTQSIDEERAFWESFYIHYCDEPMIDYVRWAVAYGQHGDIIMAWSTISESTALKLINSKLLDRNKLTILAKYYNAGLRLDERMRREWLSS